MSDREQKKIDFEAEVRCNVVWIGWDKIKEGEYENKETDAKLPYMKVPYKIVANGHYQDGKLVEWADQGYDLVTYGEFWFDPTKGFGSGGRQIKDLTGLDMSNQENFQKFASGEVAIPACRATIKSRQYNGNTYYDIKFLSQLEKKSAPAPAEVVGKFNKLFSHQQKIVNAPAKNQPAKPVAGPQRPKGPPVVAEEEIPF